MEALQRQLTWSKRQTSFAWGKYYEEVSQSHQSDTETYHQVANVVETETTPQFIIDELSHLLVELKMKIDCPICLDIIDAGDIGISKCGHKYCNSCLEKLKTTTKSCAICRKKLCK